MSTLKVYSLYIEALKYVYSSVYTGESSVDIVDANPSPSPN